MEYIVQSNSLQLLSYSCSGSASFCDGRCDLVCHYFNDEWYCCGQGGRQPANFSEKLA